jgi:hypothetical protein
MQEHVLCMRIFQSEANYWQKSRCWRVVPKLVFKVISQILRVAVITLFAITNYHWPICWIIRIVSFVWLKLFHSGIVLSNVDFLKGECLSPADILCSFHWCDPRVILSTGRRSTALGLMSRSPWTDRVSDSAAGPLDLTIPNRAREQWQMMP